MNNKASIINTFSGGMSSDYDPQRQQNNTYLYSMAGRIIFNKEGTISWENDKGTKKVLDIGFDYGSGTGYKIIGCAEVANRLVVFSTQSDLSVIGYSEIGIIEEQQVGVFSYQTVFNDKYDRYQRLLYFNQRYQIVANAVFENDNVLRVYWNDDLNEPRVFNVLSGREFGYSIPYPLWYSSHSMDRMMDVEFGLLKYRKNVAGNLTAGKRSYTYRLYHRSGYATPWAPLAEPIMMTASQVNKDNWTQYVMTESGAESNKGHELEIKYIDQRFEKIEVACALYETDAAPIRADIIFKGDITGDSMIITHANNNGIEPIPAPETLVQRYTDITKAKTQVSNENYLHNMNLELRKTLEIDTLGITVEPIVKRMLSDEKSNPNVTPLTHQTPKTTTVTKPLFSGFTEVYEIDNDYINYKGTQWEHLFKSRWRDSVYPLAIVLFSRKGQPFFAQYIGDFKTPAQNNNTWELKRLSGVTTGTSGTSSDYYRLTAEVDPLYMITDTINQQHISINIMGLKVGGIDLTDVLYDDLGRIQISGFSIVQADRVPDIICQGLLMNAVVQNQYSTEEGSQLWLYPLTTCGIGAYQINATGTSPPIGLLANLNSPPSNNNVGGFIIEIETSPGITEDVYVKSRLRTSAYTFESPEYLFNQSLITNEAARKFSVEGNCQAAFLDLAAYSGINAPTSLASDTGHFYTKQYHTFPNVRFYDAIDGIDTGDALFTQYGITRDSNEIVAAVFEQDNLSLVNGVFAIRNKKVRTANYLAPKTNLEQNFFSQGHQNTVFCSIPDIPFLNGYIPNWEGSYSNFITYFIANYRTGLAAEILSDSVISNRIYKNIGHFVPINETIIQAATQEDGKIIFNDVEVWGGDCYPDYFGYTRLLPYYTEGCDDLDDYSIGMVFPVESSLNLSMRRGITYERNATMPKWNDCEEYPGGSVAGFNSGIFYSGADQTYRRLEEFQLNSVLNAADSLSSYFVKSIYYTEVFSFPTMETVTEQKYPGEIYDSWRKILVNNFQYADATLGSITSAQRIGMNVYILQQGGFGRVRYNERTLATTDASNLTVGTGQGYQGHDYIDQSNGCQHQFSVVNTGRNIYWVDANQGKMWSFGGNGMQPISDIRGMHDYFTETSKKYWQIQSLALRDGNESNYDNPILVGGIASGIDPINGSVIVTFTDRLEIINNEVVKTNDAQTIEYNDIDNKFVTFQPYNGQLYMNLKRGLLVTNPNDPMDLYQIGAGERGDVYGTKVDSVLKIALNGNFLIDKVFDNAKVNINPDGALLMSKVTLDTEGQIPQEVLFNSTTDNRPVYRNSYMTYPMMEKGQKDRLRGKFLIAEYLFLNQNDDVVRVSSHETFYRKNYR